MSRIKKFWIEVNPVGKYRIATTLFDNDKRYFIMEKEEIFYIPNPKKAKLFDSKEETAVSIKGYL